MGKNNGGEACCILQAKCLQNMDGKLGLEYHIEVW